MARILPSDATAAPPSDDEDDKALASAAFIDKSAELKQQGHAFIDSLPLGIGQCVRTLVHVIFCPSVKIELCFKIFIAVILYVVTIIWLVVGIRGAEEVTGETLTVENIAGPRSLHIDLTACVLAVSTDTENRQQLTLHDSTLRTVQSSVLKYTSLQDSGTALFVSCEGPPKTQGFLVAAYLQVGADVQITSTTIVALSAGRSSLQLLSAPYGKHIEIRGDSIIAQLESLSVQSLAVVVIHGLVDIRNSQILNSTIQAGMASISVSLPQQYSARVQLHRVAQQAPVSVRSPNGTVPSMTMSSALTSEGLCISDISTKPGIVNKEDGSAEFSLAPALPQSLFFNVTRGCKKCNKVGQLYFSRGVKLADRSEANTFDTTGDTGYIMEKDYSSWAETMHQSGRHLLRMRVLGPGIDDEFASIGSRSEWVYSQYSDVYIWHPASLFWISTMGLFSPATARSDALLETSQCTPRVPLTGLSSICTMDKSADACSAKHNNTVALGIMHATLWNALPNVMTARNSTLSELYYVKGVESTMKSTVFTSIGGLSIVTKFTTSAYEHVESTILESVDRDPWKFMDLRDRVFYSAWWFLIVAFPLLAVHLGVRFYCVERDKIVIAKADLLWPRLWASQQKREIAISGRPQCKWGASCYRKTESHKEKYCHPGDPDWERALPKLLGSQVRVTSDKDALVNALEKTRRYRYLNEMDAMLGGQFVVQKVKADGMVGLHVDGQDGCVYFPDGTLSSVESTESPGSPAKGSSLWSKYSAASAKISRMMQLEKTAARIEAERRAHKYLAHATHFFTVIDAVIITRLPESSNVDGLPATLFTVCVHYLVVVLMCLPVYIVCWLQLHNVVDEQTDCAFYDMVRSDCLKASNVPTNVIVGLVIGFLFFMLFYTIVVYLCRQIDDIARPVKTADGRYRMSRHRRRLFSIRASLPFHGLWWTLSTFLVASTIVYFVTFFTYITLAACVFPERLTPVLLGIVAVVFVAKETYTKLHDMRQALEEKLKALPTNAAALEKTIREEMCRVFDEKLESLALGVTDAMVFRQLMLEEMCVVFEETLETLPGGVLDALGIDHAAIQDMCDTFDQNLQSVPGANGDPVIYGQTLHMGLVEDYQGQVDHVLGTLDIGADPDLSAIENALKDAMQHVFEKKLVSLPGRFGDVATWPSNLRTDLKDMLDGMRNDFSAKVQTITVSAEMTTMAVTDFMTTAFAQIAGEVVSMYAPKIVNVGNAVIFALKSLEEQIQKLSARMRIAFEDTVEQIMDRYGLDPDNLADHMATASAIPHAIDDVLREHGFTTAQILLVTVVTVLIFAVFIAFILLGCSMFMHPSSMLPTLISSGMVLASTFTMIKSGRVDIAAADNSALTKSFAKHLSQTQKMSGQVTDFTKNPFPDKLRSASTVSGNP